MAHSRDFEILLKSDPHSLLRDGTYDQELATASPSGGGHDSRDNPGAYGPNEKNAQRPTLNIQCGARTLQLDIRRSMFGVGCFLPL